jgi:predicted PurR-regulated permease PerM
VLIPYFGASPACIPPCSSPWPTPGQGAVVFGIYILVQQIEGNVSSRGMSKQVSLHPRSSSSASWSSGA